MEDKKKTEAFNLLPAQLGYLTPVVFLSLNKNPAHGRVYSNWYLY
jgi:hypothetical protein